MNINRPPAPVSAAPQEAAPEKANNVALNKFDEAAHLSDLMGRIDSLENGLVGSNGTVYSKEDLARTITGVLSGQLPINAVTRTEGLREAVARLLPEKGDAVMVKQDGAIVAMGALKGEFAVGSNLQVPAMEADKLFASSIVKEVRPQAAGGFVVVTNSGSEYEVFLTGKD